MIVHYSKTIHLGPDLWMGLFAGHRRSPEKPKKKKKKPAGTDFALSLLGPAPTPSGTHFVRSQKEPPKYDLSSPLPRAF